jgi:hypothetical protein
MDHENMAGSLVSWYLLSGNQTWQWTFPELNGGFELATSSKLVDFPASHV